MAPGGAEPTTIIRAVRDWHPDYSQLAAASALVGEIRRGRRDLESAERELDLIMARVRSHNSRTGPGGTKEAGSAAHGS
jgi:uncharacterized membrane protein YjjP (DUF1212 family)